MAIRLSSDLSSPALSRRHPSVRRVRGRRETAVPHNRDVCSDFPILGKAVERKRSRRAGARRPHPPRRRLPRRRRRPLRQLPRHPIRWRASTWRAGGSSAATPPTSTGRSTNASPSSAPRIARSRTQPSSPSACAPACARPAGTRWADRPRARNSGREVGRSAPDQRSARGRRLWGRGSECSEYRKSEHSESRARFIRYHPDFGKPPRDTLGRMGPLLRMKFGPVCSD